MPTSGSASPPRRGRRAAPARGAARAPSRSGAGDESPVAPAACTEHPLQVQLVGLARQRAQRQIDRRRPTRACGRRASSSHSVTHALPRVSASCDLGMVASRYSALCRDRARIRRSRCRRPLAARTAAPAGRARRRRRPAPLGDRDRDRVAWSRRIRARPRIRCSRRARAARPDRCCDEGQAARCGRSSICSSVAISAVPPPRPTRGSTRPDLPACARRAAAIRSGQVALPNAMRVQVLAQAVAEARPRRGSSRAAA